MTPFIIVNFSHNKRLHLDKDHVIAFAEKDCNEGEVLEICTMEELEWEFPQNWVQECQRQTKMTELFEKSIHEKER